MDEMELLRAGWELDARRLKSVSAALVELLDVAGQPCDPGNAFAVATAGHRLADRLSSMSFPALAEPEQ